MKNYLFPDGSIPSLSNDGLFRLIAKHLPTAKTQLDGIYVTNEVAIDYAQDQIDQARDELLRRGVVFSAEQKEELNFLRWGPVSEEPARQAYAGNVIPFPALANSPF